MEGFDNHKLPVLGDEEATDSAKIVASAKAALTTRSGKAFPKLLERINILRYCVSEEVREMWAALTADIAGAPADDYPDTIDPDSTDSEAEELTKKREWHVEWLEAVISYHGRSQQDSAYEAVRQFVEWDRNPTTKTRVKVAKWALSCSKAQEAVTPDAWSDADPKALFSACARTLPESIRALLQQNKPESGLFFWKAYLIDQTYPRRHSANPPKEIHRVQRVAITLGRRLPLASSSISVRSNAFEQDDGRPPA
jgi:hypothetical protein